VALVVNDVREQNMATVTKLERISDVREMLAVTGKSHALRRNTNCMREEAIDLNTGVTANVVTIR
jgi:hypothetical protein